MKCVKMIHFERFDRVSQVNRFFLRNCCIFQNNNSSFQRGKWKEEAHQSKNIEWNAQNRNPPCPV